MLVAEELALLLLDDERGRFVLDGAHRTPALAGAVLADLVLAGRVGAEGGQGAPARARLVVLDDSPTGHAILDAALAVVTDRAPAKPGSLLGPIGRGLEHRLLQRLVAAGAVREERARVWGLFPTVRHPAVDGDPEARVRSRVAAAVRSGRAFDERTTALVALLSATGTLTKVQDPAALGMSERDLREAGRAVADDDRVATAVRKALASVDAAAGAAVVTVSASSGE